MHRTKRTGLVATLAGLTIVAAMLFAPAASAKTTTPTPVTPPPSTVPIGGGTNSTITGVMVNGNTTTLATVAPGSTINMQATLTLGPGVNPGWVYWVGYGWVGAPIPSGCSFGAIGVGATDTTNFTLAAPTTAGVYEVGAALGPDYCPWAAPVPGPTIAKIVVVDYSSLCSLAQSYSSDPGVAMGLCDKLLAAEAAGGRGQTAVKASILRAFGNQVLAQSGKALTTDEADMLLTLSLYV